MHEIKISADELVKFLLNLPSELNLCLLDSCGVSHLNSHLLIAGIQPLEILELNGDSTEKTLKIFSDKVSKSNLSLIFTISYDFGLKLNKIKSRHSNKSEPDIFIALFDALIIHDYKTKKTYFTGNKERFDEIQDIISNSANFLNSANSHNSGNSQICSNFTQPSYIEAIEKIHEYIRCGDTYQTNLTQQIRAKLPPNLSPETIFQRLRKSHPAPFASFIRRKNDVVISASPERFFKVENGNISTSPIKGTRPRGKNVEEDLQLKNELLNSEKDRAENVMIVDLLRNDLGRICDFGTVEVEKLYELEEHPSLFHLVSTISGKLRKEVEIAEIIKAVFPCGSITGAPKIRTMQLIDEIETASRGLSMGAIGFATNQNFKGKRQNLIDISVAIRTLTIRQDEAVFNVGGGIVIDSLPENEYEETLVKARAIFKAIGADEKDLKS